MQFLNYKDYKIAYQLSGSGFPVVLLHGFCEDQSMWDHFTKHTTEHDYQIITVDLPGFGHSDMIPDLSIREMAEIIHYILDSLELKKVVLLGHSMGGYVGLAFAAYFSERLSGLGLVHSHPYADSADTKIKRNKAIAFLQEYGSPLYAKGLIPLLFPKEYIKDNASVVDQLVEKASQLPAAHIIEVVKAMRDRPDRQHVLIASQVPVLFIVGKKDLLISEEQLIQQTYLSNIASIEIFPEIGHMGPFEAPEKINRAMVKFLEYCLIYS